MFELLFDKQQACRPQRTPCPRQMPTLQGWRSFYIPSTQIPSQTARPHRGMGGPDAQAHPLRPWWWHGAGYQACGRLISEKPPFGLRSAVEGVHVPSSHVKTSLAVPSAVVLVSLWPPWPLHSEMRAGSFYVFFLTPLVRQRVSSLQISEA